MAIPRVDNDYVVNSQDGHGFNADDFAQYIAASRSNATATPSATTPDWPPEPPPPTPPDWPPEPPPTSYRPNLTYHGGYLLQDPTIYNIYVGNFFNTANGQQEIQYNDGFAQEFDTGSSSTFQVLNQYNVGTSTFGGSTVIGGNPTTVTEADVQNYIKQALASGALPANPQGIYNVVLPPGTVLLLGIDTSETGLGGFHGSFANDGTPVYFSVIAYSQGKNGIDFTGDPGENITITESHEWAETMTDPDVNSKIPGHTALGWYADSNTSAVGREIGDLAMDEIPLHSVYQPDSAGYMEQLMWSNRDQLYELPRVPESPRILKPKPITYA
jgi:hypothetical protein